MPAKRSAEKSHVSSLLTTTATCSIPRLRASWACSLVCPLPSKPDSKPPSEPSTSRSAASACAAPVIMFGMKSRWPGASSSVTLNLGVWNPDTATSTVTPRARSSGRSSSSHAQEKEALPACAASFWFLCTVRWSTRPRSCRRRPISVDLPASTCPSTTRCNPARPPPSACSSRAASSQAFAVAASMTYSSRLRRAVTLRAAISAVGAELSVPLLGVAAY
mmetsp:Transcript_12694/g.32556  ORF Transcript_12694/g.32556 Transcript_12694/m.32556 type:complete len:220 (+) Transcript_12694:1116-1775(+)